MLLNALTGKGLSVDPHTSRSNYRNVYIPPPTVVKTRGGLVYPPPFYGRWDDPVGMGIKKKRPKKKRQVKKRKGEGLLLGKNSPFNSIPLIGALL